MDNTLNSAPPNGKYIKANGAPNNANTIDPHVGHPAPNTPAENPVNPKKLAKKPFFLPEDFIRLNL